MKKKLTSSIIIPYYNAGKFIDETINAINNQTRKVDEIIIINDGSFDKYSLQKLSEIQKKYPHIKIIHQKNQGVHVALTNGVKAIKGDIVFEIDADDIPLERYIERYMNIFEKDNNICGVTSGYISFFDGEDYTNKKNLYKKYMPIGYREPDMFFYNCLGGQNSAFRKKCLEKVDYYTGFKGPQDWGVWLKFYIKGYEQYIINEYLYLYRLHKKGLSQRIEKEVSFDEEFRKMMEIIKKTKISRDEYLTLKNQFWKNRQKNLETKKIKLNAKLLKNLIQEAIYSIKREGLTTTTKRIKNFIKYGKGIK